MTPAQRRTLAAAIMGSFVALMDATVVNVALPAIEDDLGGGLAGQQWVVNAYLLLLGSLILLGGSLGDLFGERRVFAIGVGGFGVVSVGCGLAPSIEVLVGMRALQGAFGALLTPAALALLVAAFPPETRGAAVGSWTAWGAIAAVVGPVVGGQLVDVASWRWIFLLNVPFVAVTLVLIAGLEVGRRRVGRPRVDGVGAALAALGLAGPTVALIEQPTRGWGDPLVLGALLGGIALLVAFVTYEARHPEPMLPLALFRSRSFSVANVQTLAMYAGLSLVFFLLVIVLQTVAGYSAVKAGLATLPTTVVMFLLSRRFGALADRLGPRPLMAGGPLVATAGLLLFQRVGADAGYVADVLPAVALFSLGLAMTVAPLTATVLSGVAEESAGIASGVNNAIARVAGLLATAAVATAAGLPTDLAAAAPQEVVDAFHRAMLFAALMVGLSGVVALVGLPPGRPGAVRPREPEAPRAPAPVAVPVRCASTAVGPSAGSARTPTARSAGG